MSLLRNLVDTLTGIRNPHVRPPGADLNIAVTRDEVAAEWRRYRKQAAAHRRREETR